MPTAAEALKRKTASDPSAGDVLVIGPEATVLEAAKVMNARRIGALPVVAGDGALIGMFSERDVLTRVVAVEKAPSGTTVGEVMTSPVFTCAPATPLREVRAVMRERRIRHMPVVDETGLVGMLSIGDLSAEDARSMTQTISYLERYMYAG